jgi:hypothetical protein
VKPALGRSLAPRTGPVPTSVTIGVSGGTTSVPSLMSQFASWMIESPEFAVTFSR